MNVTRRNSFTKGAFKRLAALALSLALMSGFLPFAPPASTASAAEWMQPYLDQMVEWGVMQGDQNGNLNEDRQITRAEFVTLVNRAFGYTEMGPNPFSDVPDSAWYAEDIRIAYQAGYFNGSSPTTAAPTALVTREQAAAMIGRSLRLQSGAGLNTSFTDNREIGAWSRGLVQEAADMGIIQGYEDGTFRPKNIITRGQVACFLARALGTLIQEPGEQTAGGVYGNLTITSPGVKLRDTTITGNLYLTGGVGLGNVELENVTVMGKIVVCGGGESQEGDDSVILRNVTAGGLEIDSLANQFITVRAEGLTDIENTTVRTSAYLEDLTEDGLGLSYIELNGADSANPPTLHLAGNIKEVKNLTPESSILVAQGVTNKLTMDEKAVDATLSVDNSASVRELNLDTATNVTGTGSVGILHVNSDGSVVSMLPDDIQVRPGITSNIYKEQMDTVAGQESSEDPRLLTGYPLMRNVASTSAEAVFSTNKKGTIRWGLSAITDGSLTEEQLLNPASYPAKVIKSGTLNATASKTELMTRLTGLTRDGSYYLSAMLVDNRNRYSPVKVAAFTTTDDSVPNFSTGYPGTPILTEDRNGDQIAQIMVMATKSCQLYYALMPKGSSTPTANAFKSGAIPGNLGFGVVDLTKDTPFLLSRLNSSYLAEQTQYELYLWLNDADNGKSSAVKKITFTTLDKTPPVVTYLQQTGSNDRTATITYTVNEQATLYWAVVLAGDTFLRPTVAGEEIHPEDLAAKIQVENAQGRAVRNGSSSARADANTSFTITGLSPETSYDLYYVAKDRAGNYSEAVQVYTPVKTLDNNAPTVTQEFNPMQADANGVRRPLTESDVTLAFSEIIWGQYTERNELKYDDFEALYKAVQDHEDDADTRELEQAKDALATALQKYITFYKYDSNDERTDAVIKIPGQTDDNWDIDFREVTITKSDGKMKLNFPNGKAINLQSGGKYQFRLQNICDTSGNTIDVMELDPFQTIFATVHLQNGNTMQIYKDQMDGGTFGTFPADDKDTRGDFIYADIDFIMRPESTEKVPEDIGWDLLLWTDTTISFTVFSREKDAAGVWGAWEQIGGSVPTIDVTGVPQDVSKKRLFVDLNRYLLGNTSFPALREFTREREIAIHVDSIEQDPERASWNENVTMEFTVLAGGNYALSQTALTTTGNQNHMQTGITAGATDIGKSTKSPFEITKPFTDSAAPGIVDSYPNIDVGDIGATFQIMLDHPGSVYYVVAPLTGNPLDAQDQIYSNNYTCPVEPVGKNSKARPEIEVVPGLDQDGREQSADTSAPDYNSETNAIELSQPFNTQITRGITGTTGVLSGSARGLTANVARDINLTGLTPKTTYYIYVVTQSLASVNSETMVYQFTTVEAIKPVIEIDRIDSENATITVDKSSVVDYILIDSNALRQAPFSDPFTVTAGTASSAPCTGFSGSVLEAMMTNCTCAGNTGTVFDNHGSTATQNLVATRIRSTTTTGASAPVIKESITLNLPADAGTNATVTSPIINMTNNMLPSTYYTLLAVGRTTNSSKDSFRASQPYYLPDNRMILVESASVNADSDTTTTVSGSMTVVFSDDLYGVVTNTSGTTGQGFYPLDYCGLTVNGHSGNNMQQPTGGTSYANIGRNTVFMSIPNNSFPGSSATDKIQLNGLVTSSGTTASHTPIGNTLTFTLNGAGNTAQIILSTNVCGSNGVQHTRSLVLALARSSQVEDVYNSDGTVTKRTFYEWDVNVTAEWDGRNA